jgi:hypothetical protein
MLRGKPGAFLPLHEPLRNPGLGKLRLAEPPSAAKRLKAMRLQGPMGCLLTEMQLSKRDAPPPGFRWNRHRKLTLYRSLDDNHHSPGAASRPAATSAVF